MSTTIDVICYKSKILSNSENPLMLRITKDRKRRYLSLGISMNPRYWDFTKNKPKRNCPNKEQKVKLITEKTQAYRSKVIELRDENKAFTAKSLIDKAKSKTKNVTVKEFFDTHIQRLFDEKRRGYALSHKQVLNSLIAFNNNHLDIYFSEIDVSWLLKYETWLKSFNLSNNTIAIRFRTLRAIYNLAIKEGVIKEEY